MLEIQGLTKRYGGTIAVDNTNLIANPGEITVLLGPNGAGKSTMMKCIIGVLRYEGSITICGHSNKTNEARRALGYVPETPALYDMLTPEEHMEFMARAYGVADHEAKAKALMDRFVLTEHRAKVGQELSKGMSQKVSLCCALLTDPKVILFDEPMVGLDPAAIRELKKVFLELRDAGAVVFISTHIIDTVREIWDVAHIMDHGRIRRMARRLEPEQADTSLEDVFFAVTGEGTGEALE